MTVFHIWLAVIILSISVYTLIVVSEYGPNLFPYFFGDMAEMGWPGQFNLDFMMMLSLSGLWVAWRHQFSGAGIALGIGAFFLGAPYLCTYLLVASFQCDGDMVKVLVGSGRSKVTDAA